MKINWSETSIFIKPGPTDMRNQVNGLSVMVEDELGHDVFSGSLYIFCNKTRRRLKILYWDKNGFCLWLKRLEKDKFPWPMTEKESREITSDELSMLLNGIDFFNAHKTITFSSAS